MQFGSITPFRLSYVGLPNAALRVLGSFFSYCLLLTAVLTWYVVNIHLHGKKVISKTSMVDELLCIAPRVKIQIYFHDYFLNFTLKNSRYLPLILMEITLDITKWTFTTN